MQQLAVDLGGATAGMVGFRLFQFRRQLAFLRFERGDFLFQRGDALLNLLFFSRTRLSLLGFNPFLFLAVSLRNLRLVRSRAIVCETGTGQCRAGRLRPGARRSQPNERWQPGGHEFRSGLRQGSQGAADISRSPHWAQLAGSSIFGQQIEHSGNL